MRKDDLLIYSAVLIYIALVQLFHFFNGTYNYMRVYFYSELLALIAILISFIFLAIRIFQGKARDYLNRDYVISFALIIALSNGFKTTFASHKQTIPVLNPFCWDSALSRLDYFIHLTIILTNLLNLC